MSKFDDFVKAVLGGVKGVATGDFAAFAKEAKSGVQGFLKDSEAQIKKWTKQVAKGELSREEFADLVKGQEALAIMQALATTAIAQSRAERLKNKLIDLVIDKAFDILL